MRALVATGSPEKPLERREVDEAAPLDHESLVEVRAVRQRSLEGKAVLTID